MVIATPVKLPFAIGAMEYVASRIAMPSDEKSTLVATRSHAGPQDRGMLGRAHGSCPFSCRSLTAWATAPHRNYNYHRAASFFVVQAF